MTNFMGYLAMALLVISFIPRRIKIVRVLNLIACLCFVMYGMMLGWKYPIIISNGLVACIQLYHLFFVKYRVGEEGVGECD